MPAYLISYDLLKKGQDYESVIDGIMSIGPSCKVQYSVWAVSYPGTATDVRDHIDQYLDDNDVLFVVELSKGVSGINVPSELRDWLNMHL